MFAVAPPSMPALDVKHDGITGRPLRRQPGLDATHIFSRLLVGGSAIDCAGRPRAGRATSPVGSIEAVHQFPIRRAQGPKNPARITPNRIPHDVQSRIGSRVIYDTGGNVDYTGADSGM